MKTKNTREAIANLLTTIEKDKSYVQLTLKQELEDFEVADRAFMTEVINGTIKYKIRLDYIINQYSKTPVSKMKPFIRNILRMSVYQLLFLEKVPPSAAINEAVKIVHKRKMSNLAGFMNGVLRTIDRQREAIVYPDRKKDAITYLSVYYSLPEWLIKTWLSEYSIEVVEKICNALNERPQVSIRVNTLKTSFEKLFEVLQEEGMRVTKGSLLENACMYLGGTGAIQESPSFKRGEWTVQDESAMLVTHILAPQAGDKVLDMCSAPGGKSTHIAEYMKNKGQVVSTDIHPHKIEIIKKNAERLGCHIIEPVLQDGTKKVEAWVASFDKVLLDAPCSGLGIIKRKPDIRYSKSEADLEEIASLQKQLLGVAVNYLKVGGTLVYSTCTLSQKENEEMVAYALGAYPLELSSIEASVPEPLKPYVQKGSYIQILPFVAHTDGFFIAKFTKRGEKE